MFALKLFACDAISANSQFRQTIKVYNGKVVALTLDAIILAKRVHSLPLIIIEAKSWLRLPYSSILKLEHQQRRME